MKIYCRNRIKILRLEKSLKDLLMVMAHLMVMEFYFFEDLFRGVVDYFDVYSCSFDA